MTYKRLWHENDGYWGEKQDGLIVPVTRDEFLEQAEIILARYDREEASLAYEIGELRVLVAAEAKK
jgi:hypothetical protein